MTEQSAYWDGVVTGDATGTLYTAPYSSAEFSDILNRVMIGGVTTGFVVPFGANFSLDVVADSPASMIITVKPGNAIIGGRLYRNTADLDLTLGAADPANPRIDRIILRVDTTAQTIRAVVLAGTAAATPSPPSLTIAGNIHEVSLAYIWVAAAAVSVDSPEIHDERIFVIGHYEHQATIGRETLVRNSEFMAFGGLSTIPAPAATLPPDGWTKTNTVTAYASATKPTQMARGRAVQITAGSANAGMMQVVRAAESTLYAFRVLVNVTAGDVGEIVLNSGATTVTKYIRRTGAWIEETIYFTTPAAATSISISLQALNNTDIVQYGQCLLVEGYAPGPYRQIHETILFQNPIGDTNWNNTAKSTGFTIIDLDADFQTLILPGVRAVILYLRGNDSGSAASTTAAIEAKSINANGEQVKVDLGGVVNDRQRSGNGMVNVIVGNLFQIGVTATGALTLDALVYINGIVI